MNTALFIYPTTPTAQPLTAAPSPNKVITGGEKTGRLSTATHSQTGGAKQWASKDEMIDSSLRLALALHPFNNTRIQRIY